MAHTFSACTPTPFAQICYNMDNDRNNYFSFHIGDKLLSYTYIPQFATNPCTTVELSGKIITTCPDHITTMYIPSMTDIQNQLNTIDSLLKNTLDRTNQCMQKLDHITGVSSGDQSIHQIVPDIRTNIAIPEFNYDVLINQHECVETEMKCKLCNCVWIKEYLLTNKLYWCNMCSIGHVFSPFSIFDFAPFSDIDKLKSFEEQMIKQQYDMYHGHAGYWQN